MQDGAELKQNIFSKRVRQFGPSGQKYQMGPKKILVLPALCFMPEQAEVRF